MRTALSRILVAAVIGATAAGVGTLYAATEPVQGTAHPAPQPVAQQEQIPDWAYTDSGAAFWQAAHGKVPHGYAIDGTELGDYRCWVEKVDTATQASVGQAEVICGDKSKRPTKGTADIGQAFASLPTGDCGFYAVYDGAEYGFTFEPVVCN